MKPNLTVTVTGGLHSGKSKLARAIVTALKKNPLYGTQLEDGDIKTEADPGDVQVLVQTLEFDEVLSQPMQCRGPESLALTEGKLKAAFLVWELENRKNGSSTSTLPAGQMAQEAAAKLWSILNT